MGIMRSQRGREHAIKFLMKYIPKSKNDEDDEEDNQNEDSDSLSDDDYDTKDQVTSYVTATSNQ